ncbi:hypothetical protein B0T18DRAFT_434287 [Schizothecium vesticola]|uniref:Aminoglycoside phosphotransferase domain-containing protein n=1 Tax=Schizothecium vesticola TaxID=314040 RepID=A0AA40F997_9PEZI|nr:hypothetical protein B0T18DRAFT_434287 [Schizothecium vesticola]
MADEPIEAWTNHEREFRVHHDRFFKRSFRPEESRIYRQNQPYVPPMGFERLENEAACLEFVRSNTAIPVPVILEAYSQDGSFVLVTERLFGHCEKEVEMHLRTLQALRSNRTGGPSGIVCPPKRATQYFPSDTTWSSRTGEDNSFVFCHGDLSQSNIIVGPETLKIEGIIDWEYAGFWPDCFETPYFRDPRPSGAQFRDESQNAQLVDFLKGLSQLSV